MTVLTFPMYFAMAIWRIFFWTFNIQFIIPIITEANRNLTEKPLNVTCFQSERSAGGKLDFSWMFENYTKLGEIVSLVTL